MVLVKELHSMILELQIEEGKVLLALLIHQETAVLQHLFLLMKVMKLFYRRTKDELLDVLLKKLE